MTAHHEQNSSEYPCWSVLHFGFCLTVSAAIESAIADEIDCLETSHIPARAVQRMWPPEDAVVIGKFDKYLRGGAQDIVTVVLKRMGDDEVKFGWGVALGQHPEEGIRVKWLTAFNFERVLMRERADMFVVSDDHPWNPRSQGKWTDRRTFGGWQIWKLGSMGWTTPDLRECKGLLGMMEAQEVLVVNEEEAEESDEAEA